MVSSNLSTAKSFLLDRLPTAMLPSSSERERLRNIFVSQIGWFDAQITALQPDASFRRYYRLERAGVSAMLMDAPPMREQITPFITIAHHLNKLGLVAPEIFHHDKTNGFILMEDFGDNTFTQLLNSGTNEIDLYRSAVDVLIKLHENRAAIQIHVPPYDRQTMIDESLLMPDWYYPAIRGSHISTRIRQDYIDAWHQVLNHLPAFEPTLVLRDFHIDNLIQVNRDGNTSQCGLLDFQDAVIGSPAYDLMSLLEDARRDITPESVDSMLLHYLTSMPDTHPDLFMNSYHILGLQRHCKVAGIFTRLATRDAKPAYREHLPRVLKFISLRLGHPLIMPVREWFDHHLPEIPNREPMA